MSTSEQVNKVLDNHEENFSSSIDRLFEFLRIPSISTDPEFAKDCLRAAEWLAEELTSLGFEARVAPTAGHPMVVGHYRSSNDNAPHALFYGHYDVQPADPLELWERDPFDPQILERSDGTKAIGARGVSDDKGQLRTFIEACRSWRAVTGDIPCNLTVLFEGEEESGSPSMEPFLREHAEELKADFALVCDTTMWNAKTPAITISLRGMAAGEIEIHAAKRDLHSGLYGSAARNPITLLSQILGGLHDADGKVTLPGFYDDVSEISPEFLEMWQRLDFDDAAFLGNVGLSVPAGEKGLSVLEQTWGRPTAEINGIIGGYTGEGFKTVIPAKASAKISFRLVPHQDPEKIWASFEAYVRGQLPDDCDVVFKKRGGSPGLALSAEDPVLRSCAASLQDEWDVETVLMGSGGSIPIVGDFKSMLGMNTVMVGFALDDDQIHSPNEKYEMTSFRKGGRSWIRILADLSAGAR